MKIQHNPRLESTVKYVLPFYASCFKFGQMLPCTRGVIYAKTVKCTKCGKCPKNDIVLTATKIGDKIEFYCTEHL